jgi:hypothetical protein
MFLLHTIYHTTECHISEDNNLRNCHCENLKFYTKVPFLLQAANNCRIDKTSILKHQLFNETGT